MSVYVRVRVQGGGVTRVSWKGAVQYSAVVKAAGERTERGCGGGGCRCGERQRRRG